MPGLRSLVARRRCSLPPTQIISNEPIVCSYPSVAGNISSRKRNSLDEINQIENVVPVKEVGEEEKPKWDLKTLFEIDDESVSACADDGNKHRDVFSYYPNKNSSLNGVSLKISEKENNSAINQCPNKFYEASEVCCPIPESKVDNLIPSNDLEEFDLDNNDMSKSKSSPERIIIKMKLLHGSSLSDVTNLAPESTDGVENIERSDLAYESGNSSKLKTRWTIDSILNQPVELPHLNNGTSHEGDLEANSVPKLRDRGKGGDLNNSPKLPEDKAVISVRRKKSVYSQEVDLSCHTENALPSKPLDQNILSAPKPLANESFEAKEDVQNVKREPTSGINRGFSDMRRSSDSSDISEDSICSEASTMSSNSGSSSDSSLKSCSIVIKRLENSDNYSCFRSPKSKRKKCQEMGLTRTVYINNKNSLPVLYIPKRLLYKSTADILPCSVTLCDIFSNYPLTKEICPRCFNFYDLSTDLFVNMCSSTLTLQCETCKWLVIRSLVTKEVDIRKPFSH